MKIDPDKEFGTMECPACACEVPRNSNRCPICKYEFGYKPTWQTPLLLVITIIVILALLSWMF